MKIFCERERFYHYDDDTYTQAYNLFHLILYLTVEFKRGRVDVWHPY